MDLLPSWFLRIEAPYLYKPVTRLFYKSIATSTVPRQWEHAYIQPVPKVATPQQCSDRPISVTPVLSRTLERIVVRNFLYPAIIVPPVSLDFTDQYAFRPNGSTTAAIVAILHSITELIIIIIIITTIFMVLSSWQSHCESSPGLFDECRMAPAAADPRPSQTT